MLILQPIFAQAASEFLLGWWKVFLMLPPFIAWAWLVSTHLEKDARFYHFNWEMWNGIHLGAGMLALAIYLIPGEHSFWISWPLSMVILAAPVLVYWKFRNDRVPAEKRYSLSASSLTSALEVRRRAKATRDIALHYIDGKGKDLATPLKDEPMHEVHMLGEDLLGPAIMNRASRVELAVTAKGTAISQTVDGVKYKRESIPVEAAIRLIDFFKGLAALDVEDRRRQQSGKFRVKSPSGDASSTTDVLIVTAGSSQTQVMRLEFNRENRLNKPFDGLGLLASQMDALKSLTEQHDRHGIVLIGAPPGHGLSTSMYSFLNRHDAYTSNIKSLERDIQVRLEGVDQVLFDPNNSDVDFATNLQSMLRRDPDVMMVGEMDGEAALIAVEPGMNGPLIYVPQRVGSVAEQIKAWIKLVGDVKQAVKPLRAVINQRLLRTLCPNCRQAFTPAQDLLKKFHLPPDKVTQLYRANGKIQVKNRVEPCPVCNGIGYLGQTAAFEVMVIDDEIRKLLIAKDLKGALDHARRNKMIYLQQAALTKAVAGETTLEELVRVTATKSAETAPAQTAASK